MSSVVTAGPAGGPHAGQTPDGLMPNHLSMALGGYAKHTLTRFPFLLIFSAPSSFLQLKAIIRTGIYAADV